MILCANSPTTIVPAIKISSPVWTKPRVEMLAAAAALKELWPDQYSGDVPIAVRLVPALGNQRGSGGLSEPVAVWVSLADGSGGTPVLVEPLRHDGGRHGVGYRHTYQCK